MKVAAPLAACLLAAAGCSRGDTSSTSAARATEPNEALGEVMIGIGHRYEMAGRAAVANRFELAEFEIGEIQEAFEGDVPHATLPKEGPTAQIAPMAADFLKTAVPELKKAAAAKDRAAFDKAFQSASAACNSCHTASAKPFIQIPSVPGKPVPDTDPLPPRATP